MGEVINLARWVVDRKSVVPPRTIGYGLSTEPFGTNYRDYPLYLTLDLAISGAERVFNIWKKPMYVFEIVDIYDKKNGSTIRSIPRGSYQKK